MVQGYSVIPFFILMLILTANFAFSVFFTILADAPHISSTKEALIALATFFGTALLSRNFLVSVYDCAMDSTTNFPLLSPNMLDRLRGIVNMNHRGLKDLVVIIHTIFCICLVAVLGRQPHREEEEW